MRVHLPDDFFAVLFYALDNRLIASPQAVQGIASAAMPDGDAVVASTTLSLAVAPAATVDARQRDVLLTTSNLSRAFQRHQRVLAPTEVASTFDTADALPFYTATSYAAASRTLALGRTSGAALDGQSVTLRFTDEDIPHIRAWHCQLPPDVTQVILPELPAPFATLDPSDPYITDRQIAPIGIRASEYAGYADYRRGIPLTAPIGSSYDASELTVDPL